MAALPNLEAAMNSPTGLGDIREKYGMSRNRAGRAPAEPVNANAATAPTSAPVENVADSPAGSGVSAAQPAAPATGAQRGPDGKFLKKSDAAPQATAPATPPASEVKRAERIKIGEKEYLPQDLEALALREAGIAEADARLRQYAGEVQQGFSTIQQRMAEIEKREAAAAQREAEAQAYQEYLIEAERKVQAGEAPSIADFLKSKQTQNAQPTNKAPVTIEELDAWYENRRAKENAARAEQARKEAAVRVGNDFNETVLAAAKASPILMKRKNSQGEPVYAENIGFRVADYYFKQGVNIATLPPNALKDRANEMVKAWEADEIRYAEQLAGEYLTQRQGQPVVAPSPVANTGTPTPKPPEEFQLTRENKLQRFRQAGGDVEKWAIGIARDKEKLRQEAARLRGQG